MGLFLYLSALETDTENYRVFGNKDIWPLKALLFLTVTINSFLDPLRLFKVMTAHTTITGSLK